MAIHTIPAPTAGEDQRFSARKPRKPAAALPPGKTAADVITALTGAPAPVTFLAPPTDPAPPPAERQRAASDMRQPCGEIDPPGDGQAPEHGDGHQDQAPEPGRIHAAAAAIATRRGWLAAVPIVLVNAVAFAGQLAFLRAHLPWPLPGQVLVAVALESVAVYLAYHAHVAQLADDSALRLRLASYIFAAVIGAMNFDHYAVHWRPTFAAVAFGLMSAASPWLWSIHSRRESRDSLKARGLIEPHAVRLGMTRWTWHPIRSARVMYAATWTGENDPAAAIALAAAAELPPVEIDAAILATLTARERLLVAWGAIGSLDVPKALAALKERGCAPDQSTSYQVRKAIETAQTSPSGDGS